MLCSFFGDNLGYDAKNHDTGKTILLHGLLNIGFYDQSRPYVSIPEIPANAFQFFYYSGVHTLVIAFAL